jgi:hypothetical protein
MPTTIQPQGEVIPTSRVNTGSQSAYNQELNTQGAALLALSLPVNAEVSRIGNSYVCGSTTAPVPVAAIPTTVCQLVLWNGEASGGKSYVIQRVSFTCSVSAGAAIIQQMLVSQTNAAIAVPTGTAALAIKSLSGRASQSAATVLSASTIAGWTGLWHPIGPCVNTNAATATIGTGMDFDCNGVYVIPPGGAFGMSVLCSAAATAQNQIFVTWHEVQIALG